MLKKSFLLLLFSSSVLFSQKFDVEKSNDYYRKAVNSYLSKDHPRFLIEIKLAERYRPNHPRLLYNIAAGFALNNEVDSALVYLSRVVDMKLYFPAVNDSDFISIFENDGFKSLVSGFNQNTIPVEKSKKIAGFSEDDFVPESVAFDRKHNTFYLSSVHKGKIVSIKNDSLKLFYEPEHGNAWSLLGMKINNQKRELWVCASAIKQTFDVDTTKLGKSKVMRFDLDSQNLIAEYSANDSLAHIFGDLVIAKNGTVVVSDSKSNNLYTVNEADNLLDLLHTGNEIYSLQGLDFADERTLYFADYTTGIYKLDITSSKRTRIKTPDDLTTLGIDGLYFYNNQLLAIQNGVNPNRLIKMGLNDSGTEVTDWEIIDSNHRYFDDPTLGVFVGSDFYYVANSNWNKFNREGILDRSLILSEPVILKVELE
ncbi:MAG: hypothetical protein K9J12_16015 [Melioribacteraceae bacterium]|nr:hypothetical protein [Melioribacteraceae bacterium]MCF8265284.1 hypothetical protein [Melioribacteraceae bacterium]MCF8412613.1 hypothetical protein [Melioribacteraceae bacterium]MCF8431515.1 hypothetical protein [Melioribacteraceae bacterium]